MGVVTVPQANPNDELTDTLINQGPNAIAAAVNGNLDDANIATISGAKIAAGSLPASASDAASNSETRQSETVGDLVASGLIWSATSGLTGTMTNGVAYVNGKRLVVPSIASYACTASRDTYVYVDSNGSIQYNAVANGAAQPTTPPSNELIAKVVTNGSTITTINDFRVMTLSAAWRTWTPSFLSFSLGNGVINFAKFQQIGKTVHFRLKVTLGTTSSVTGGIAVSLPVATANYDNADSAINANVALLDTGNAYFPGQARWGDQNYLRLNALSASSTYLSDLPTSSTDPFAWGGSDIFAVAGSYEAA